MPARRRRPWVKFSRKVKHILHKQVAPKFSVYLRQETVSTAANKQNVSDIHTILGLNGFANNTRDVGNIVDRAYLEESDPLKSNVKQMRVHISGWMAETQITNTGPGTAYIDMYYWRAKADVPNALVTFSSIFSNGLGDLASNFPVGGSTLDALDYGVTPFQSPQLSKSVRIWKKTRVKLAPGGVTQIETRSGKDYYRKWGYDEHLSMGRGCTEGVYFIIYGVPSTINAVADPVTVLFSTNVNFTWRLVESGVQSGGTTQA